MAFQLFNEIFYNDIVKEQNSSKENSEKFKNLHPINLNIDSSDILSSEKAKLVQRCDLNFLSIVHSAEIYGQIFIESFVELL